MRIQYEEHSFTPDREELIERCDEVLEEYAERGIALTVRQLYYQCVTRDLFPDAWADPATGVKNRVENYNRLKVLVAEARLAGRLDWDHVVDLGRETRRNAHWDSPAEILRGAAEQFRMDKWSEQTNYVEVMVEKQALESVLRPVCAELDVAFSANKGYASASFLHVRGREIGEVLRQNGWRTAMVLYLGDHDPSGLDMDRDVQDRLRLFAGCADWGCGVPGWEDPVDPDRLLVERVALTGGQIRRYKLAPDPAKLTDARAKRYVAQHGRNSWELDALDPQVLAGLVRDAVGCYRNDEHWRKSVQIEERHRSRLMEFANTYEEQ